MIMPIWGPQPLRKFLGWTEGILASTGMTVQVILCRNSIAVSCQNQTGSLDTLSLLIIAGDPKSPKHAKRQAIEQLFAKQAAGAQQDFPAAEKRSF